MRTCVYAVRVRRACRYAVKSGSVVLMTLDRRAGTLSLAVDDKQSVRETRGRVK
jgi:hypothetical protein